MVMRKLLEEFNNRWLNLFVDVMLSLISISLATLLSNNLEFPRQFFSSIITFSTYILFVRILSFLLFDTYTSLIRFFTFKDVLGLLFAISFGSFLLIVGNMINVYTFSGKMLIPFNIIIIDFALLFSLLIIYRLSIRFVFFRFNRLFVKHRAILYNANEMGLFIKNFIDKEVPNIEVVAFIDKNKENSGKKLENVPIFGIHELDRIITAFNINYFILPDGIDDALQKYLLKYSEEYNISFLNIDSKNIYNIPALRSSKESSSNDFRLIEFDDRTIKKILLN